GRAELLKNRFVDSYPILAVADPADHGKRHARDSFTDQIAVPAAQLHRAPTAADEADDVERQLLLALRERGKSATDRFFHALPLYRHVGLVHGKAVLAVSQHSDKIVQTLATQRANHADAQRNFGQRQLLVSFAEPLLAKPFDDGAAFCFQLTKREL